MGHVYITKVLRLLNFLYLQTQDKVTLITNFATVKVYHINSIRTVLFLVKK